MKVSNENISYEKAWEQLRTISEPAMLIVAIIHLGKLLFEIGEKRVFGPLGLSVHEFEALFMIRSRERITPTHLAQYSLMPPARITRLLDRLEQREAIVRRPVEGDRRSYSLSITDSGLALFRQAVERFKGAGEGIKKDLGPDKLALLSQLIIGFIDHLGG
jgi:DNA-binding MarR family transcriptional regulator